ncbi:MAG: hypothetical protein E7052_09925 [Lentisphaerae bacterium]|nr:hypothetical protein [Lentisphaerota bacterium]
MRLFIRLISPIGPIKAQLAANAVMPPPGISRGSTVPYSLLAANAVMPPPGISRGATMLLRWLADPACHGVIT